MATRPYSNSPWPEPTPDVPLPPAASKAEGRSLKRRRLHSAHDVEARGGGENSLATRQVVVDQALIEQARRDCQVFSGNEIISCYPTADVSVPQHQWATFVWNSRRPDLTQINLVDIFLFRADSRQEVLRFTNQSNPSDQAGVVTARVDDRWFGSDGERWSGSRNITYPFYWVIIRSDKTLDGNEIPQTTFSAIQTTYADSVASSMSSASVASASSASAVAASLSSLSASAASVASATRVTTINGTPTTLTGTAALPSGEVQSQSSSDSFPRWAIAVIVVLGFLAIAATCILAFLILRRIRRRNKSDLDSHRNSMGSASPMMANVQQQASPILPPTVLPTGSVQRPDSLRRNDSHGGQNAPSVVLHDGASGVSGEGGPFSGADAAIMADAFRKMLRKPDFAAVEEGDSPDGANEGEMSPTGGQQMISRELAEEGRDIRSVGSSRGVKVESQSDGEHPRDSSQ